MGKGGKTRGRIAGKQQGAGKQQTNICKPGESEITGCCSYPAGNLHPKYVTAHLTREIDSSQPFPSIPSFLGYATHPWHLMLTLMYYLLHHPWSSILPSYGLGLSSAITSMVRNHRHWPEHLIKYASC